MEGNWWPPKGKQQVNFLGHFHHDLVAFTKNNFAETGTDQFETDFSIAN
jgi:hypothetical protein